LILKELGRLGTSGDPTHVIMVLPLDAVASAHAHPNEDKGETIASGVATLPFNDNGPSATIDKQRQQDPVKGYYNIVIDKNSIYFYDKKQTISVPRSKL
jgi:hypothetical protein